MLIGLGNYFLRRACNRRQCHSQYDMTTSTEISKTCLSMRKIFCASRTVILPALLRYPTQRSLAFSPRKGLEAVEDKLQCRLPAYKDPFPQAPCWQTTRDDTCVKVTSNITRGHYRVADFPHVSYDSWRHLSCTQIVTISTRDAV